MKTSGDYDGMRSIQIPAEGKSMEQIEAEAITHTLELTEGNRSAASRILGISRPTLLRKIRKHGLQRAKHELQRA